MFVIIKYTKTSDMCAQNCLHMHYRDDWGVKGIYVYLEEYMRLENIGNSLMGFTSTDALYFHLFDWKLAIFFKNFCNDKIL